jgi:hypothetical protein
VFGHHQMKLNPSKYDFSIKERKFWGFLVTSKGIEPNLEKILSHSRHDSFSVNKRGLVPHREIGCPQLIHNILKGVYCTIL